MPPFVDDPVRYPNEVRLVRILKNDTFWYPKDVPTRASSGAYLDTTKQNSCFVADQLTVEHFELIAQTYPDSKLGVVTAGHAREHGYSVCEDDPSDFLSAEHVVLCPPQEVTKKDYIRMAKRLAPLSTIYQPR
jgi:hypothetical protein